MEIAEWLKPYLNVECPHCGTPIVNNEKLTDRYCPNPKCLGHMSQKVADLAKRFGVKGVGPSTAKTMILTFKFNYHVDAIPIWFPEKPHMFLYQVGECAMIKGFQKSWRDLCAGKDTMAQVVHSPNCPDIIKKNYPVLAACERHVIVVPELRGSRINVMMSGSFEGYRARKDFITKMNLKYGDLIQLVDVGKRKTGVDFLIKESYTSDHEKSAIAAAAGIRVITPAKMEEALEECYTYIREGGEA